MQFGKVWIQLFFCQLLINGWTDWVFFCIVKTSNQGEWKLWIQKVVLSLKSDLSLVKGWVNTYLYISSRISICICQSFILYLWKWCKILFLYICVCVCVICMYKCVCAYECAYVCVLPRDKSLQGDVAIWWQENKIYHFYKVLSRILDQ